MSDKAKVAYDTAPPDWPWLWCAKCGLRWPWDTAMRRPAASCACGSDAFAVKRPGG